MKLITDSPITDYCPSRLFVQSSKFEVQGSRFRLFHLDFGPRPLPHLRTKPNQIEPTRTIPKRTDFSCLPKDELGTRNPELGARNSSRFSVYSVYSVVTLPPRNHR